MDGVEVYVDSIKEVVVVDGDLSWKYKITNDELEGIILEYWETNLSTKKWEMQSEFRIDKYCAKEVSESILKIIAESK